MPPILAYASRFVVANSLQNLLSERTCYFSCLVIWIMVIDFALYWPSDRNGDMKTQNFQTTGVSLPIRDSIIISNIIFRVA